MIIYKTINLINNKCYIGQTTQKLKNRKYGHLSESKNGTSIINRAIKKYGIDNFKWEIIGEYETPEILNIMETFMIMVHKTHRSQGGYNLTWGGECGYGYKHTEEAKKKMSKKKKGIKQSKKQVEARVEGRKGYKPTEKTKRKMSEVQKIENFQKKQRRK